MSNWGAQWGEQISHQLTAARANEEIARGNRELEKAEAYHRGTIAQLSAALKALKELAPEHPLHQQAVLDAIDQDGTQTATFQEAWHLIHDPSEILARLQATRAAAVAALLPLVEQENITVRAGGFLWLFKRVYWWGDHYKTREAAEASKNWILQSLRTGTINDPHVPAALKRAAWSALGFSS